MMDASELTATVIDQAHTIRNLRSANAALSAALAAEQNHCAQLHDELAEHGYVAKAVVPSSGDASPGSGDDASDAAAAD